MRFEEDMSRYKEALKGSGIELSLIRTVGTSDALVSIASDRAYDTMEIVVGNIWHHYPSEARLQSVQKLWKLWADIHSPDEPDRSRITVVDLNGDEVGGSREWAGSVIWVAED